MEILVAYRLLLRGMNDWKIQARARVCQSCGHAFADKEPYHTVLYEQRSGFDRMDICSGCWESQHREGSADRKGFVSHWQGSFVLAPPPPPDPIQRDSAESLLRRLVERGDPAWQPASYILAVMLERKRVLKIRQQVRQEGRRVFVYELPKSGEVFTIADPDLKLDQLEQVQRDVARLLEVGLPVEASPTEEPFVPEMVSEPAMSAGEVVPEEEPPGTGEAEEGVSGEAETTASVSAEAGLPESLPESSESPPSNLASSSSI